MTLSSSGTTRIAQPRWPKVEHFPRATPSCLRSSVEEDRPHPETIQKFRQENITVVLSSAWNRQFPRQASVSCRAQVEYVLHGGQRRKQLRQHMSIHSLALSDEWSR